jgi:hypothetical protein
MNQHGRDEFNITIKINGYEYLDSSRVSMDFDVYHPITNNYLLRTSECIQRGSSFILSGNLEKVNKIQVTYLSFINLFSSGSSRTVTTSNTVEATREIMSSVENPKRKKKGKARAAIRTKVKIPKLANLAVQNIDDDGECSTPVADNNEEDS